MVPLAVSFLTPSKLTSHQLLYWGCLMCTRSLLNIEEGGTPVGTPSAICRALSASPSI